MKKAHNRKKLLQVIEEMKDVHGETCDYSLITEENYDGTHQKVPIICKIHKKVFYQAPIHHIRMKFGCPQCAIDNSSLRQIGVPKHNRKLCCGVGFFDSDITCNQDSETFKIYLAWKQMITRCYSQKYHEQRPTYRDCTVCDEWLRFSNFLNWALRKNNGFKNGYQLDKDIIIQGNKTYSPDKCVFIPREINDMFLKRPRSQKGLPTGVVKSGSRYWAVFSTKLINNKIARYGSYKTEEEAYSVYIKEKEKYIKAVAKKYYNDGKIVKKAYDALMAYKLIITDK